MKKIVLMLAAAGTVSLSAYADHTIRGRVTYSGDNEPLIGATIAPVGGGSGTATDLDGEFTLTVADGVKYVNVSYVGMKTKQVAVASDMQIALDDNQTALNEVVVTAMGIKREKKALGYSSQELNADNLNTNGSTDLASAIQGKLTGVQVRQSSGAPGASSQIVIRGARSFDGNNQPLCVVDGMPIETQGDFGDVFNGSGVTGADHPSHSLDINPEDIESINVLKGQAASALYGIRASNGVVVISTKRGSSLSSRPVVTFSTNISAESASRTFKHQNVYAQGDSFTRNADGTVTGYNPSSSSTWGPKISELNMDTRYGYDGITAVGGDMPTGGESGQYYNPKYVLAGLSGWSNARTYDNVSDYFQTGYTENTNFNISQKKDNLNYSFGVSNTYQKGIMPSTGMSRWGARGLVDLDLSKEWKTGFSMNYSSSKVTAAPGANSGIINVVYSAPAEYNLKGTPYSVPDRPQDMVLFRTASFRNPYWFADNDEYLRHTNRTFGNAYLEYHPRWLNNDQYRFTIREQAGVDAYTSDNTDQQETYNDAFSGRAMQNGRIENYGVTNNTFNNLFTVNFDADWNDWNLNVLLGNEIVHTNQRYWDYVGNNLNYYGFPTMSNTTSQSGEEYKSKKRTVGFFGQATASWRNELFLTVTGRQDYVSSMPHGNRGFFYPSVSLGWVFTELPALKAHRSVLNYGKLRASWAQVGQAGEYYDNFYYVPSFDGGFYQGAPITFPMNGVSTLVPYYVLFDPNLKPQNTSNVEFGADLNFFNNRLRLEYTASYQNITDQIFDVPVSGSTGYQYLRTNAGRMHTWSHELAVNVSILQARDYLNLAIDGGESHLGSQDILFNGNNKSWIGLAYALKARYALHLQLRDGEAFTKALGYAQRAKELGFEGAELTTFDDNNYNPWTAFFYDREYTGSSSTVSNLMAERNDPRSAAYLCPTYDVETPGVPGTASQANTTGELATPSWLLNTAASIHVFSASELNFIIAECKARLGQDASSEFAAGVKASFTDYEAADGGIIGFSSATADEYIATLPVTLNEIMVQKYLAMARDEQVETFNDLRRAKANGEEFVAMTNPRNASSTGNALPLRMPYGESDVRSNPNVRAAFGTGNAAGSYVFTENVWWAGGSR